MLQLLIATHNRDKLKEIAAVLPNGVVQLLCMDDFPGFMPVPEDRDTIDGNAIKKATQTARELNILCLADDTGLFVDALNGEPGVFAARFAGEGCSYRDNRVKLLAAMRDAKDRNARFETCVALAAPDGLIAIAHGSVAGIITREERGQNGFGYDAVFEVANTGRTFGEMDDLSKNRISHRALAIRNLLPALQNIFSNTYNMV
jgi:XTP/dITP diphosphohydrolase